MAKFTFENTCYIAHIHSSSDSADTKPVWNEFLRLAEVAGKPLIVRALFRPTDTNGIIRDTIRNRQEELECPPQGVIPRRTTIAGVITPDDRCLSVIVDVDNDNAIEIFTPGRIEEAPYRLDIPSSSPPSHPSPSSPSSLPPSPSSSPVIDDSPGCCRI